MVNEKRKSHYERIRQRVQARNEAHRRPKPSRFTRGLVERSATATAVLELFEFVVQRESALFKDAEQPPQLHALCDALHAYRQHLEETV